MKAKLTCPVSLILSKAPVSVILFISPESPVPNSPSSSTASLMIIPVLLNEVTAGFVPEVAEVSSGVLL